MTKASNKIVDRVKGILVGLAAGDRNGGPLKMATLLAESLLAHNVYFPSDVAERYLAWWKEGAFDTGRVLDHVMRIVDRGVPIDIATAQTHSDLRGETAGCNPAHRVAPIAMAAFIPDDKLVFTAKLETANSHWDPIAGEVAAVVALMCRLLAKGLSWEEATREVEYGRPYRILRSLRGGIVEESALVADGFSPNVLQASMHFLARYDGFDEALKASLAFAGPAAFCPVLVGAIGGARWGASTISPSLLTHLSSAEHQKVESLAAAFASLWN